MSIIRRDVVRGPARIIYRSAVFFSKGDITLDVSKETFVITSSVHGKTDERVESRKLTVSFTPVGEWEALPVLWPYGAFLLGQSVFDPTMYPSTPNTGNDFTLQIHSTDGRLITVSSAAVTNMSEIDLSPSKTMIGGMTFTGIGRDGSSWEDTNSLYTEGALAFSNANYTGLSNATIKTHSYSAAWGNRSAPWNNIKTADGWRISLDVKLSPLACDDDGLYDMVFEELNVTARCKPLGVSQDAMRDALKMQGSGMVRGSSLAAAVADDLVIRSRIIGGPVITLTRAALKTAPMAFGPATLRNGEVLFVANRNFDGNGQPTSLCTIA